MPELCTINKTKPIYHRPQDVIFLQQLKPCNMALRGHQAVKMESTTTAGACMGESSRLLGINLKASPTQNASTTFYMYKAE